MADNTVTPVFDLIPHQRVTHPASVIGADRMPEEGSLLATIWIYHALHEATANTSSGSFFVQTRGEALDDQWVTVATFLTSNATAATSALTATEPVGETVIAITSSASFLAADYIYIDDATSDTDDEWHFISEIDSVGTDLTLAEGLVAAKAAGDDAWTDAEAFYLQLDLAGVFEYRVIYIHQGATGADTAIWVRAVEVTDFV